VRSGGGRGKVGRASAYATRHALGAFTFTLQCKLVTTLEVVPGATAFRGGKSATDIRFIALRVATSSNRT